MTVILSNGLDNKVAYTTSTDRTYRSGNTVFRPATHRLINTLKALKAEGDHVAWLYILKRRAEGRLV